jgi:hypothetical protein
MRADDVRHGTTAGYRQHLRDKQKSCTPCRLASNAERRGYRQPIASPNALPPGKWRPVKGILRFFPETVVLTVAPPPVEPVAEVPLDDPIACPICRARATETCRTRNGHKTRSHNARVIPRRCATCTAEAEERANYCAPCARASERTKRRQARERPAA